MDLYSTRDVYVQMSLWVELNLDQIISTLSFLECFLPITLPSCDCTNGQTTLSKGKQVILIGINGKEFLVFSFSFIWCFYLLV